MRQKNRILMMITATGIGLSLGWLLPAQQASGPQWKDRAEYDLYEAYTKAADGKSRLAALEKWTQGYPDSEMVLQRDELYLGVYGELKDNRKAFDKAKAMRAKKPEHYYSITTILSLIYGFTPLPPAAADLATAEETAQYVLNNADKVFAAANKPGNMTDQQFAQARPAVESLALRTNAWIWVQRKDDARSETELTKVVQADPAQPQFSYMLGQAKFNQYTKSKDLSKVPDAIFHIARAGVYDGAGAIPAQTRTTYTESAARIYRQYHGSDDGWQEVLAAARSSAMPPAGFRIKSVTEIDQEKFASQAAWDEAHPIQAWWRDNVRMQLTGADAESLFESNYKEAGLPPAGLPFSMFKGTILSMTPETNPKELEVAIFDANVGDAKLVFDTALPGDMPLGSEIEFKGTVKAFQKEPFMVTFDVDMNDKELVGWTGVAAKAAPKGKAAAAKPAPKGKGK